MLKVGLTGGIGSGKSTVAQVFKTLGIPIFEADASAKYLMNHSESLKNQLIDEFGAEVFINKELNRKYLSNIVFNNSEKLSILNSIVHPAVIEYGKKWMEAQITPYAIKEAAIFFETGSNKEMDYMIGVTAPLSLRIERTMKRDHVSKEEVERRMNNQMNESEKMSLCDFVIHNDNQTSLIKQIINIHELLLFKIK